VSRPGPRGRLEAIWREALAAVDAEAAVRGALARDAGGTLAIAGAALPPGARLHVVAAGKAAAAMARGLEAVAGERIAGGLAVVKDGHGLPLARIALREAAHPVPDARCERAAREALACAEAAEERDVLVVLLSGGASSLLACPAAGLRLADLAATTELLLRAGAPIDELNAVRKHLSALAGGRLAQRARAGRIEVLAISDVSGDRIDVIGSGPCAPDPSTFADALAVLERCGARGRLPPAVRAHLEAGARGERPETAKPGDPRLRGVRHTVLAGNAVALEAARAAAPRQGLRPLRLGPELAGEARVAGRRLAALARALRPAEPVCLLGGGETVVSVRGGGRGGRCQELALAAAIALQGWPHAALLAAGTDGSDGPTDAAGAFADGGSAARGRAAGVDARAALADNDSYGFFAAEGGLLRTGPTRTNVRDLVLVEVRSSPPERR
jgi:glycerate 2-kinase